jgi:3-hydroxyacyl-CoA dehydrogenase/3a,7a,12a-trihydroxy-5b-cholest-24-enoyl-CoA hydratase
MSQKSVVGGETSSDVIFEQIRQRTAGNPGLVPTVNAIFRFRITKDCQVVKQWTIDLKNQPGSVAEGPSDVTPDCTLTISDSDFVDMATGKLNGQQAFMSGKLTVSGNVMLAQKLQALFKDQAKL